MEVNQRDKTIEQLNKPIPITMANMDQQIDAGALVDGTTFLTEPKTQQTSQQQPEPAEIQVLNQNEQ